jgi:hypothetical protein
MFYKMKGWQETDAIVLDGADEIKGTAHGSNGVAFHRVIARLPPVKKRTNGA